KGLIDSAPVADPQTEHAKVRAGVRGELPSAINPPSGCRFRTRCPLAEQVCAEIEPPLTRFSEQGHLAACHFPLQTRLTESGLPAATQGPTTREGAPVTTLPRSQEASSVPRELHKPLD